MNTYTLKILVPGKKIYDSEIVAIMAKCENGYISVLAGHEPMVANLVEGPFTVRTKGETMEGTAGSGLLLVVRNEAVIMVRSFVWAGDDTEKESLPQEPLQTIPELF